ncbi:hypothetical protein CGH72_21305 [Vibrio parahaemolyticus]|uniref:hypothetical protein n=1 Tax=Vibrio parahaemolyticus TaxID=670 RepID=UPI00111CA662|nr:hypothetical protein [Vibrio parahaemolyticus]TOM54835.1 hypothetical protein CGH75_20475 [Vibrio parahaemolyticus]TOM65764.1 hypothetical protein CGH73_17385 [Vibrio parahaemolyticus]TOM67025.1 hypothetical protein CGH72_21305 [Vibrio parahaemolyticus]TOO88491.1 hypothetical protein CGH29_07190 [Vibrio parahaemolyticus]
MSKRETTLIVLEAALERIVQGKPEHIPATRKLSVRAIEEEANLGNGSGYYYPDFVQKVKAVKAEIAQNSGRVIQPEIQAVRSKLNNEKRIKENYREKYESMKADLTHFAAAQHHLNDKLVKALSDKEELEIENANLRAELAKLKRSKVVPIK